MFRRLPRRSAYAGWVVGSAIGVLFGVSWLHPAGAVIWTDAVLLGLTDAVLLVGEWLPASDRRRVARNWAAIAQAGVLLYGVSLAVGLLGLFLWPADDLRVMLTQAVIWEVAFLALSYYAVDLDPPPPPQRRRRRIRLARPAWLRAPLRPWPVPA